MKARKTAEAKKVSSSKGSQRNKPCEIVNALRAAYRRYCRDEATLRAVATMLRG